MSKLKLDKNRFTRGGIKFTDSERQLLQKTIVFTPTSAHTDGSVDGFIEIRRNETNELTNLILQVQNKATSKDWMAETDDSFEFRCSDRDSAYWLQGQAV